MTGRAVRLAVAAAALAGWFGYMAYLAATTSRPVVVSRPQMLVADVCVVARVDDPGGPAVVEEVLFARRPGIAP